MRSSDLQVHQYDSIAQVDAALWEDLWLRDRRAHIYQKYDWYRTWEEQFAPAEPVRILIVRSGERAVGAAALMVHRQCRWGVARRRILTFLSSHSSAYPLDQGPLLDPACEEEVLEVLARHILGMKGYAAFQCELFEAGSPADRLLDAVARRTGREAHRREVTRSHLVDLALDYEAFIQGLGSRTRRNVRNYSKKFFEGGADRAVTVARTPGEMRELLAAMRRQKRDRFEELGAQSNLDEERLSGFLDSLAERLQPKGWMHGVVAQMGDAIAATQLFFLDEHGHAYSYNSSFDPEFKELRLHYLVEAERFKEAIARGYGRMDLSTGHDEHKRHWSGGQTRALLEGWVIVRPLGNACYWLWEQARERLRRPSDAGAGSGLSPSDPQPAAEERQ